MDCVDIEYRVLGYAPSELQADAEPFLIVFKMQEKMRSYLLQQWQTAVGCTDEPMAMYIEDILQELRDHADDWAAAEDWLFSSLAEASVGPLRTLGAGCLAAHEFNVEVDDSQGEELVECSADAFRVFLNILGRHGAVVAQDRGIASGASIR